MDHRHRIGAHRRGGLGLAEKTPGMTGILTTVATDHQALTTEMPH
jgi:hypothetical protein